MWQPIEEKEAERELIKDYASKTNAKILRLQDDEDNQGIDGTIERDGKIINVEARRKGYPNHRGRACAFKDGWNTSFLLSGVMLNERTIAHHKDNGFDFIVEINGFPPRVASLTSDMVEELLNQPKRKQKSTNTGAHQSVKFIPLDWFKEY